MVCDIERALGGGRRQSSQASYILIPINKNRQSVIEKCCSDLNYWQWTILATPYLNCMVLCGSAAA